MFIYKLCCTLQEQSFTKASQFSRQHSCNPASKTATFFANSGLKPPHQNMYRPWGTIS